MDVMEAFIHGMVIFYISLFWIKLMEVFVAFKFLFL